MMLNHAGRVLEWYFTDQWIWRKIEVFLNGAGECFNTVLSHWGRLAKGKLN